MDLRVLQSKTLKSSFALMVLCFVQTALGAYDYYYKLSSLVQDVDYLATTLAEVLAPSGYTLIPDSIHISDAIGGKGMGTNGSYPQLGPKIKNDKYTLRVIRFSALTPSKTVYSGWTYLIVARTDKNGTPLVQLSSQARKGWSERWKSAYWISLAINDDATSFILESRPQNFHLTPGYDVPENGLPNWGVPRANYPRASSFAIAEYLKESLSAILEPMKFKLIPETIDLDLQVLIYNGPKFLPSLRIIETKLYTARYVLFMARGFDQKLYQGSVILILSPDATKQLTPNKSLKTILNPKGIAVSDLFLSIGADMNSFPIDVRYNNLELKPNSCSKLLTSSLAGSSE